jgi:integrase
MQKHLIRRKRKATGKFVFYGQYSLKAGDKPKRVCLDTADKKIAERKLDKIFAEAQQEEVGFLQLGKVRLNEAKPVLEHLNECLREKELAGCDQRYLYGFRQGIKRLVKECGWGVTRMVTPDSFEAWRARQSLNAKTLNDYLTYARTLLNWMEKRGRITANPLKTVDFVKKGKKSVYQRRALSDEDVSKLLGVAGPRKFAYQTVLLTGLRRAELGALQWRDLFLETEHPKICLRAETTKNGKADVLPIHLGLLTEFQALATTPHALTDPVFPKLPTMEEMRLDLCTAGIPFVEEDGRRADFHALRHTFCTNLHRAGLQRRVAMELMRHNDSRLTDKVYADGSRLETSEAVSKLKSHGTQAAGTHGTHNGTQTLRLGGNQLTQPDTGSRHMEAALKPENQAVDPMGIKLTQLEPKGEMVRGTGFEPVTPTVSV